MHLAPTHALSAARVPMWGGAAGLHQTLRKMRELVAEGRVDPVIRSAAIQVLFNTPEKSDAAEVSSVFQLVRDHVRYLKDVHEVETLATARKTLQTRVGDCDDKTVLLASLLESVGYPTRFVVTAYQTPEQMEHVYLQVNIRGEWVDADATEEGPLGYSPPNPVSMLIERV